MTYIQHSQVEISTDISQEFPIQDFIDALWFNLGKPLPPANNNLSENEFWNRVIHDASKGKAVLFLFQRTALLTWIKANYFHITAEFSNRAKITLQHRMKLL